MQYRVCSFNLPQYTLGVRDSQNFIHDKYREKISRYLIYRDSGFETIKNYTRLRRGQGVT